MKNKKILFWQEGIPIYELPNRFLFRNYRGLCRNGEVFVRPDLPPLEQIKTVQHELRHREFYLRHRILGVLFSRQEFLFISLFLFGFLFFLGHYALAFVVALPWWANVLHEISVYVSQNDGDMARSLLTWLFAPCFMIMVSLICRILLF